MSFTRFRHPEMPMPFGSHFLPNFRGMFRPYLLFILLIAFVPKPCNAQPAFRSAQLDALTQQLQVNGSPGNLQLIDAALRNAGPESDPRVIYFMRRYRSEQLYYQGLLDESMVEAETARRIAIDLNDSALISSSLNQVAVLLEEHHDNVQGVGLLQEALRWHPARTGHVYPLATPYRIYGNLGLCWANLGEIDSALFCQERSLALAQSAGVPRGEALALLQLGRLEKIRTNLDSALVLFDRSIAVATSHGARDVLLDALAAKAEAYADAGRTEDMQGSLNAGHAVMNAHDDIAARSVLAFLGSEVRSLAKTGRYKAALATARSWGELDRTMQVARANTAENILREMHITDAGLAEERDRALITVAEVKAEERTRLVLLTGAGFVLILLATLVLFFMARSRQKGGLARLAVIQAEQERQIADLQIRQQVAEDLHDDLGAGLSALKLNSELAADLCSDHAEQMRTRNLAAIAGNLMASMRHILWSLGPYDRSIEELVTYVTDRARIFCAQHDRSITIKNAGGWPKLSADAELRHLAWPVVRDALNALNKSDEDDGLKLELRWDQGLLLSISCNTEVIAVQRSLLVEHIADHHLQVSRIGGWLRTPTEGPPRLEVFLPCAGPEQPAKPDPERSRRIVTGSLVIACFCFATAVTGQGKIPYRNPVLDQLFSKVPLGDPPTKRINTINAAIAIAEPLHDDHLMYHLLMARAKEMYYQGLYDMGIADVNRSLELAKVMNDSLLIATTFNMIGLLNENLNNDAITLPWFRTAAQWLPPNSESAYPVVKDYHIDANIAQCLLNLGKIDSAQFHFTRSLERAIRDGDERAMALANLGLARAALVKGPAPFILPMLDSARAQSLRSGSSDVYLDAQPVRALYMLRTEGGEAAIHALDEGLTFLRSDSTLNRSSMRKFFEQASFLRETLGQYEMAYGSWQQWQHLDSAMRTIDDRAALATLRVMLDNGQHLQTQRTDRERSESQLAIDRSLRRTTLSTTGIAALLLIGIFALLVNRQKNKRNLEALELERIKGRRELAQLRMRQRLSEDMLAELGTGLEALRIRSQLSAATHQVPEDRERMALIASQATELAAGLKQIVWALDTGRSTLTDTVRFTSHYANTYCAQQNLKLRLSVQSEIPAQQLTSDQRRNIFLVVKEALHNVVKHAHANEVELSMTFADELVVRISDNGRGPSASVGRTEGNGMRNMQKRIEALGGEFHTSTEKGMTVHFIVPLSDNNGSKKSART